jgi:benzoyl-CoA reductase/2-hydroxyglutaryl-CoA dehydratase subunit BcrC/BadD/HgdB
VGETTCDGKKKMFELMNEIKETFVLQLPSSRDEQSLDAWEKEIIRFWKKLEDFYGPDLLEILQLKYLEEGVMVLPKEVMKSVEEALEP